jgi:DNA repair protein RadA/Sms
MAKSKVKTAYVCGDCGAEHTKWQGQCNTCTEWNTLSRVSIGPIKERQVGFAGAKAQVKKLGAVEAEETSRISTTFSELDRVLGGGMVPGSVILIGCYKCAPDCRRPVASYMSLAKNRYNN